MNKIEPDMNTNQLQGSYKKHIERQYLGVADLSLDDGNYTKYTVVIDGVYKRKVYNKDSHQLESVIIISFKDRKKDLIANRTNQDRIEAIAGTDLAQSWVGVSIVLAMEKEKDKKTKKMEPRLRVQVPQS